jgi:hypothetical protein
LDRRRLDHHITPSAHRALRLLHSNPVLPEVNCAVEYKTEFACARLSDIRLDIKKIEALIKSILGELVKSDNNGYFDQIAQPLLVLEKPVPGISNTLVPDKPVTILDVADTFVGDQSGSKTVRAVLKVYRELKRFSELFANPENEGVLLAGKYCKSGSMTKSFVFT